MNQNAQGAFGNNPNQTSGNLSYLSNLGTSAAGLATQGYGPLTQAGNSTYNTQGGISNQAVTGGQQANQQLGGVAAQTIPAAQGLLSGYEGGMSGLYSSYLPGAQASMGSNDAYANQALQTGFDPQQQLFNQQFQQQQQQNLASQAQAGVAASPYGAQLSEQGNQNFDINWQQSQLQREQTAAGTASALQGANANTAGVIGSMLNQELSGAQGLYGQGTSALGTGASALSSLLGTASGAQTGGANAMSGLYGTASSDLAGILGAGSSATTGAAGQSLAQQQNSQGLNQQTIADLLSYLSGSSSNAIDWASAISSMYGASTGQYSAANTAQTNQANINAGGLSGLGSGLGTLLGLGLAA